MNAKNLELKTYISEEKIQSKVQEIGKLLTTQLKGKQALASACFYSGGRIWTCDLRVMSSSPVTALASVG